MFDLFDQLTTNVLYRLQRQNRYRSLIKIILVHNILYYNSVYIIVINLSKLLTLIKSGSKTPV